MIIPHACHPGPTRNLRVDNLKGGGALGGHRYTPGTCRADHITGTIDT